MSGAMMDADELKTTMESDGDIRVLRLAGEKVAPAVYSGETTKKGRSKKRGEIESRGRLLGWRVG